MYPYHPLAYTHVQASNPTYEPPPIRGRPPSPSHIPSTTHHHTTMTATTTTNTKHSSPARPTTTTPATKPHSPNHKISPARPNHGETSTSTSSTSRVGGYTSVNCSPSKGQRLHSEHQQPCQHHNTMQHESEGVLNGRDTTYNLFMSAQCEPVDIISESSSHAVVVQQQVRGCCRWNV